MKQVHLSRSQLADRSQAHRYLKDQFGFPDYYGHNLDALWDVLTEIGRETVITLDGPDSGYSRVIEEVIVQAAEANPRLILQRDQLRFIGGAQLLNQRDYLPHELYRQLIKSDYAITFWLDNQIQGWLIAQQGIDRLYVEDWSAEDSTISDQLLEHLMRDWPHRELVFMKQPPSELPGYTVNRQMIELYQKQQSNHDI